MSLIVTGEHLAEIRAEDMCRTLELLAASNTPDELGFTNVQDLFDYADELPDTDDTVSRTLARP